jgi:hypothetical protein
MFRFAAQVWKDGKKVDDFTGANAGELDKLIEKAAAL